MAQAHLPTGCWRIPQWTEVIGSLLPRPNLNWLEVSGWPEIVSMKEVARCVDFWRSRKVALIKQTSYWGMYDPAPDSGFWQETVLQNQGHLGPISFLADLGAEYFVVHQEKDPECFLWKEKYVHCPDPEKRFQERLREMEIWLETPAGKRSVRCADIPWDRYDLVICLDIPVPDRIVQKCRKTLWAYFSTEPGSPLQKSALRHPRKGYRLFLNHGFRKYRSRPRNRAHVLEFPFSFQSLASWEALGGHLGCGSTNRCGVLVETGSWQEPFPSTPISCTRLHGNIREYLNKMFSHRYAVRTNPKPRWGNWAIEAVLSGNLFLGNASALDHRSPLLPDLVCPNLTSALRRIEELELFSTWPTRLACQREMVENLSFRRPLAELTIAAQSFFQL